MNVPSEKKNRLIHSLSLSMLAFASKNKFLIFKYHETLLIFSHKIKRNHLATFYQDSHDEMALLLRSSIWPPISEPPYSTTGLMCDLKRENIHYQCILTYIIKGAKIAIKYLLTFSSNLYKWWYMVRFNIWTYRPFFRLKWNFSNEMLPKYEPQI